MYEAQLEHFLVHHAVSMEAFAAACQDALDNSAWLEGKGVVEVVLAMAEYPFFISMMSDAAAAASGEGVRPDLADEGGPGAPPPGHGREPRLGGAADEDFSDLM